MKSIVLTLSLFLAQGFVLPTANGQCHITIIEHVDVYIDGCQQNLTCASSCQSMTIIQWFLLYGESWLPIGSPSNDTEVMLSVNLRIRHNGTQFKCVANNTYGMRYEENITIIVRELEHTLNITASQENAVLAGTRLTLTCTAMSTRPVQLQWLNSNLEAFNSTSFITISPSMMNGCTVMSTLTFDPLKTSHADLYTCSSVMDHTSSVATATYQVIIQIPPPLVTIQRDPPLPRALSTGDSLTITCSAVISNHVDTPTTVEAQWTGWSSLRDSPRVTVSQASPRPPYDSSISITSLTSSDTGTYQCCVQIRSSESPFVSDSDPVLRMIDVFVCQLDIMGHEEPLTIGIPRDIICSWTGNVNVTKMEWFLVGLKTGGANETVMGESSILLTINPSNEGLDETILACRATLSDGQTIEESITLSVKALLPNYISHSNTLKPLHSNISAKTSPRPLPTLTITTNSRETPPILNALSLVLMAVCSLLIIIIIILISSGLLGKRCKKKQYTVSVKPNSQGSANTAEEPYYDYIQTFPETTRVPISGHSNAAYGLKVKGDLFDMSINVGYGGTRHTSVITDSAQPSSSGLVVENTVYNSATLEGSD